MDQETLELLKWLIAIPAAILVLLTMPYVIMKYHLECRKLRYEIWKLEESFGDQGKKARKEPGSVFSWMAHYWPIPCYGSLALLLVIGAFCKSPIVMFSAFLVSLVFFVTGSAIAERYWQLTGKRPW